MVCGRLDLLLFFCHWAVSNSLRPHGLQHSRILSPLLPPRVYSISCPLSGDVITSTSVIPFSSCLPSFPAVGTFPMSRLFTSGGQSIGASASASVLPTKAFPWCGSNNTVSPLHMNLQVVNFQRCQCQASIHVRHEWHYSLPSIAYCWQPFSSTISFLLSLHQ